MNNYYAKTTYEGKVTDLKVNDDGVIVSIDTDLSVVHAYLGY